MKSSSKQKFFTQLAARNYINGFTKSIWLFPVVLAIPLIVLTIFRISGSSIGAYRTIFYGGSKDTSIIANHPQSIRSDEWLVTTQMTIAQSKAGFPRINHNIGNGQDMSVGIDVPYKEWSILFRPQSLVYFVLPLENAFAFHWWLFGYLLIVSCYFFVLALFPGKRLFAAGLGIALFFSAYVQWWYAYGTLGSLYYCLFIGTAVIYLFRQKQFWRKFLLAGVIAYLAACFALILYPPYQIGCALVLGAFLVGYFLQQCRGWTTRETIKNLLFLVCSAVVAAAIVLTFVLTRYSVIKSVENTAYPGRRTIASGGIYPDHFLASQLGHQFLSPIATNSYLLNGKVASNQSEDSNFLLLVPFLILPSFYLLYRDFRNKLALDWPLFLTSLLFIIFLLELFVPSFTTFSKLFLLNIVGPSRLFLGIGFLNFIIIMLFVRNVAQKKVRLPLLPVVIYGFLILAVELFINLHAYTHYAHFIRLRYALLYALPLPLVIYFLLRKRFVWAIGIYLLFALFIGVRVNPLYQGLGAITNNPLSAAVRSVAGTSTKRWISDGGYLENVGILNNKPSLSGVYDYPQFSLWDNIPNAPSQTYNRYAHVGFDLSGNAQTATKLVPIGNDSFQVETNPCSNYLRQENVGFLVSSALLNNSCLQLAKTVSYPILTLYIYRLTP